MFGSRPAQNSPNLVELRAGKLNQEGKKVTADPRKGKITININEDGFIQWRWFDRTSNAMEDDLLVFPEEAVFESLAQFTSGRAFVLKFSSSSRRMFYWMQEPNPEVDGPLSAKISSILRGEGAADTATPMAGVESTPTGISLTQAAPARSTASPAPAVAATPVAARPAAGSSAGAAAPGAPARPSGGRTGGLTLEHLKSSLQTLATGGGHAMSLNDVLVSDHVEPLIDEASAAELMEYLPPELPHNMEEVRHTLRSPQLMQAMRFVSEALVSGQGRELLMIFGLDPSVAPTVEGLVEAIHKKVQRDREQGR